MPAPPPAAANSSQLRAAKCPESLNAARANNKVFNNAQGVQLELFPEPKSGLHNDKYGEHSLLDGTMRILRRYFIQALLLLALPAVSTAQERAAAPVTERQAAVQLVEGDWEERYNAVMFVMELGPQASPDLRLAVIDAAWAEVRGETDTPNESEAVFDYMQAVAEMGDPRAIPFLVATLEYGSISANALADFGVEAFPAVLKAVSDPDEYASRIGKGLTTLRFMIEDGTLTAGQTDQVRTIVRRCLSGKQPVTVVRAAVRLALTLKDPELRGIVETFANDRVFAETLVSPYLPSGNPMEAESHAQFVNSIQMDARTFLDGGGAHIGPFRRRMVVTIH